MRILQVCGGPSWGGMEMQTVALTRELLGHDHSVMLFCSDNGAVFQHASKQQLPCSAGLFDAGKNWMASVRHARKVLRNFNPDIIHVQRSHDLSVMSAALKLSGSRTPLCFTRRMESRVRKKSLIHRFIYGRVNHAWCVSTFVRHNFLATSPMKPGNVSVMNNGIDMERFNPDQFSREAAGSELGFPPDAVVIGMSGRISPMKGHADFIQAAHTLLQKTDQRLYFVMAGGPSVGEEVFAESIYQLAKELLPENTYRFVGQSSEMEKILSAFDVYVFPSHRESFGNVLLEAMAMKLPIVSVNAGGVGDMISCGVHALCVEPQQPEQIASQLLSLLQNSDERHRLASAAREKAAQFDRHQFVIRLIQAYDEIIARNHS